MAYGCVYFCTLAPSTSEYSLGDPVVFPCETPCADFTIPDGPNVGTEFVAFSEECCEWPPSASRAPTYETFTSGDKGIVHRVKSYAK